MKRLQKFAALALLVSFVSLHLLGELSHRLYHHVQHGGQLHSFAEIGSALSTDSHADFGATDVSKAWVSDAVPCAIAQALALGATLLLIAFALTCLGLLPHLCRRFVTLVRAGFPPRRRNLLPWACGPPSLRYS